MEIKEGLTFDDVLLIPQYSEGASRSTLDISVKLCSRQFKQPLIPANMKSIMGLEMALRVIESGGLAILHRFMPIDEQISIAEDICNSGKEYQQHFAVSVGIQGEDADNVGRFVDAGVRIVCIDIAHGNSRRSVQMVESLHELLPQITIIAGNVATGDGARRLWEAGADVVKVGVGNGSLCTTRIETGNGVPQLTALMDVQKVQQEMLARNRALERQRTYPFISDGGCKSAGDVVKALCFADMVMTGNLFAGCEETPGITHMLNGFPHKEYVGSSTHKTNHVEGVEAWMPCTSKFETILTKLLEGLRSGMSYQGANNLQELKENPQFIRITPAGLKESHPHDVIVK